MVAVVVDHAALVQRRVLRDEVRPLHCCQRESGTRGPRGAEDLEPKKHVAQKQNADSAVSAENLGHALGQGFGKGLTRPSWALVLFCSRSTVFPLFFTRLVPFSRQHVSVSVCACVAAGLLASLSSCFEREGDEAGCLEYRDG
jgi:hypothetical protein